VRASSGNPASHRESLADGLIVWRILHNIRRGETLDYDYGPGKLESLGRLIGLLNRVQFKKRYCSNLQDGQSAACPSIPNYS